MLQVTKNMLNIDEIIVNCGFGAVGVAPFEVLNREREQLAEWLDAGMHGAMGYMERSSKIRDDLRFVFPDVKSVIVTLTPYSRVEAHHPTVAAFAHNFRDYHVEIKNRLHQLLNELKNADPSIKGRVVVDSAPVFERAWAVRAGLGWIGRSSMLIHPSLGGYTLIGLLLINRAIEWSSDRVENSCPDGCTLCRDACPNRAIGDNCTIDARRCISYLTIESDSPPQYAVHGSIFGCDRCMEVCPFNSMIQSIKPTINVDWQSIDEDDFRERFCGSSLSRSSLSRIKLLLGR